MLYAVVIALVLPGSFHRATACTGSDARATFVVEVAKMQQGRSLARETVDEMWEHFFAQQSYRHVANAVGVSRATVKRYAEIGDPGRKIEPFWDRYHRVVELTKVRVERRMVHTNADIVRNTQEQVLLADRILSISATLLIRQLQGEKTKGEKVTMTSWAKLWAARNDTLRRMCPFDERQVEETTSSRAMSEYDDWSIAELAYIDHVKKNDRPTEEQLAEFIREHGHEYNLGPDGSPIDVEAEHQRWGAEGDGELGETG
jgi:hypothetical protein